MIQLFKEETVQSIIGVTNECQLPMKIPFEYLSEQYKLKSAYKKR